jgi:hypothetical protein
MPAFASAAIVEGIWLTIGQITAIILISYLLIVWVAMVLWTYRDIQMRTQDRLVQIMSVLFVGVFNLPGLILYLLLRPADTMDEAYAKELEAQAFITDLQRTDACPACRRRIENDFVACPYCAATLREPCASCGRNLAMSWVSCPYCAAERTAAPAVARGVAPAPGRRVGAPARPGVAAMSANGR